MLLLFFFIGLITGMVVLPYTIKITKSKPKVENEHIHQLVDGSRDVIYHYDVKPEFKFVYISPSLDNFLGEGAIKEALENPYAPYERIHPDDYINLDMKIKGELDYSQTIVLRWKDNEGNYKWFEEYVTPIYENGELVAVQGFMRNIDEKVKLQQELEYRINHDSLTDLYNRDYFESQCLKLNEQINTSAAIIVCDLDDLKKTNDTYGHKKGDSLIRNVAEVLRQFSTDEVIVARLGGDEFVLLVTGKTKGEVKLLVSNILKGVEKYNNLSATVPLKISIGCAFSPNSFGQMMKLFAHADKNMYFNKIERKRLLYQVH